MARSIRIKFIAIFALLTVTLLAVTGGVLFARVTQLYLDEFAESCAFAFSEENPDFISALYGTVRAGEPERVAEVLRAHAGLLGADARHRNWYILDAKTADVLAGSNSAPPDHGITRNIAAALSGEPGLRRSLTGAYMDCAVPISAGEHAFIIYVLDDKSRLDQMSGEMLTILVEAMVFGLFASLFLAVTLSGAMSSPMERLTEKARDVAEGRFSLPLPVIGEDEIGGLTAAFNEMSDRLRETLDEIGDERDKLNTLFARMSDGVAAFSSAGVIISANPAAEVMLRRELEPGGSYEDALGGLIPLETVLREGSAAADTELGGRNLHVSVTYSGGTVMAIIGDVTLRAETDRTRREFISSVSHELRTPLTNVRGYAETLTEGIDPETAIKFAAVIVNEADRMTRIVSDLLTLSRMDYGETDFKPEEFKVDALLTAVYDAARPEAARRGQNLSLEINGELPYIVADKKRLEQALLNVVNNAEKYSPDGASVEIAARVEHGEPVITVKDRGVGIPEEERERVFERFYRVDKARSREIGGTGLGLAIAREIVRRHGGDIELSGVFGEGTTVTIRLPRNAGDFS